jgi:hypothetical protein
MNIPQNQITYKKKIGESDGHELWGLGTMGGLHLIVKATGATFETVATGPHKAIARHIAKKKCPGAKFDSLEKSESLSQDIIDSLSPTYEALTDSFRKAQGL